MPEPQRKDSTRLELASLSLPALIYTVAMIAFPFIYTIWLRSNQSAVPA